MHVHYDSHFCANMTVMINAVIVHRCSILTVDPCTDGLHSMSDSTMVVLSISTCEARYVEILRQQSDIQGLHERGYT